MAECAEFLFAFVVAEDGEPGVFPARKKRRRQPDNPDDAQNMVCMPVGEEQVADGWHRDGGLFQLGENAVAAACVG